MNLTPDQIDTIESAGMLDGQEVKLIRTKGGFWMGISKGKVLSAGSHPAIVKHMISKMHSGFQPALCKSENLAADAIVDRHSHFLSDDLRKSGHDIYSVQTGNDIEFQITRHNLKVGSLSCIVQDDSLFIPEVSFPEEFKSAMAAATVEKAKSCESKKIRIK